MVIVFFNHQVLFSQTPVFEDYFPFQLGLKAGYSNAQMHGSEIDGLVAKYGNSATAISAANAGIRFAYSLKKWLDIEIGPSLSGNGFKLQLATQSGIDWSSGYPREFTANLFDERVVYFLEIPLGLRVKTSYLSSKVLSLYGGAGINYGFVFSASENMFVETTTDNFPNQGSTSKGKNLQSLNLFEDRIITDTAGNQLHYSFNDYYRKNNIFLAGEIGIEKRLENVGFFFEVHYEQGLLNFNKLSAKARTELAAFHADTTTSNIVFLGEPDAFFKNIKFSLGLNIYFSK
jgi:hypothetical protein